MRFNIKFARIIIINILFAQLISFSYGAKLYFSSDTEELIYNCPHEIKIMIDTQGSKTSSVGIGIFKDDSKYKVNEFTTNSGVFSNYTLPINAIAHFGSQKGNEFLYTIGTNTKNKLFNGEGRFGSLIITPLLGTQEIDLNFYMLTGIDSDDSNISYYSGGKIYDSLTQAINGHYKVIQGECNKINNNILEIGNGQTILINNENVDEASNKNNIQTKDYITYIKNIINNDGFFYMVLAILLFIIAIIIKRKKKK